jgi:sugar phosphate isomerase/epimerase
MRLGLVIYSFKEARGDAYALMDRAAAAGLRGVEFPPEDSLPATTPEELGRARAYAAERGLGIVADGGVIEEAALRRWIPQAAALAATTLRVIVSRVLGGNRRQMDGGWGVHLGKARDALRAVRSLAEAHDVTIAVENHQDIASDELVRLCQEVGGRHIGITLDTGSALAVAESPLGFARRVGPFVRNVHLKDYHVFLSPTGYRLSTCAIGDGVVDFPALFSLFAGQADLPMSIELGARQARHVELLEESWWSDYPPRRIPDLLDALRAIAPRARRADEDYRIPHEREAPAEELRAYELGEFERSVAYLKRITAGASAGQERGPGTDEPQTPQI